MPNSGFNLQSPQPFSYQFDSNRILDNYRTPMPQGNMDMNWGSSAQIQAQAQAPGPPVPGTRPGGMGGFGGVIKDPTNMTGWQKFAGGTDLNGNQYGGWGMPALGAANSVMTGYLGFQNMKNAKDTLNFQKEAFSKQFENQRTLVNNELRDRDAARARRDPSHQSTTKFA